MESYSSSSRPASRASITSSTVSSVMHRQLAFGGDHIRPPQRTPTFSHYRSPAVDDGNATTSASHEASAPRYAEEESMSTRRFPSSRIRGRFARTPNRNAPARVDRELRTPERKTRAPDYMRAQDLRMKTPDRRWYRTPERGAVRGEHGQIASNFRSHFRAAEVELDESIIAKTPAKEDNDAWLESLGFNISVLKISDERNDEAENRHPNMSAGAEFVEPDDEGTFPKPTATGPSAQRPRSLFRDVEPSFTIRPSTNAIACNSPRGDRSTRIEEVDQDRDRAVMRTLAELQEAGIGTPRGSRRHTDLNCVTSSCSQEPKEDFLTPSRVSSARRRRASARVSTRELRALFEAQGQEGVKSEAGSASARRSARKSLVSRSIDLRETFESQDNPTKQVEPVGAAVVLSPVRATKQQRAALGSENIVTPVRRSLRISQKHTPALKIPDLEEQSAERLDSANYAYVPNPSLKERLDMEPRTPIR